MEEGSTADTLTSTSSPVTSSLDLRRCSAQDTSISTEGFLRPANGSSLSHRQNSIKKRQWSQNEDNPTARVDCGCLGRALVVMEELETQRHRSSALTTDVTLSLQGRALDHCDVLLECKSCAQVSHSVMLLILLCEKLFNCRQQLWSGAEIADSQSSSSGQHHFGNGKQAARNSLSSPRILFGKYEISSSHERAQVTLALQSCFLQRLSNTLGRFEELAASEGWQTQLTMVVNLKDRVRSSC